MIHLNIAKTLIYLQKHWFKVAFMSILIYLFVEKDFRFSFNLNAPADPESIELSPMDQKSPSGQKKEIFTERTKETKKILDKFEIPSLFGKVPKSNPMLELMKVDEKLKHDYLKRFAKVVINERRKFGIPSSIILACGLLQSAAGQRDMSRLGNNHFALTCTLGWEGETGSYDGNCYRHYENAWTSFRDHSIFLTSSSFGQLSTIESSDYKSWAKGLEQLGYGGDMDNLANNLVEIIEFYGLNELDHR